MIIYDVYLNSMHDSGTDSGSRWMFYLNPKLLGRCPKKIYPLSNLRSFLIIFILCCSRKNNISSPGFTICFPPKKKVEISCHHPLVAWSMGEGSSRFRLFVELLEARLEETWNWKPGSSQNIIGIIGFICFISLIFIYLLCILFYIYICMFTEFTVSTGCFPHSDHWKSLLLKLENMCKKIESNSMLMGNICKMNNFHANVSCIVTHPKNRKFKPCNGKLNFFIILGVTVQENKSSYHILPSISIAHCKSSVVCEPSKTDER